MTLGMSYNTEFQKVTMYFMLQIKKLGLELRIQN